MRKIVTMPCLLVAGLLVLCLAGTVHARISIGDVVSVGTQVSFGDLIGTTPLCYKPTDWYARHGISSDQYQAEFNNAAAKGYTIRTVSGYQCSTHGICFAALFSKPGPSAATIARHNLKEADYQADFNKNTQAGYRLVWVNGYTISTGALQYRTYFNTYWVKDSSVAWYGRHGLTQSQYQAEFNAAVAAGYRPTWVSGYGGLVRTYAAVFTKEAKPPAGWRASHGLTSAEYQKEFDTALKQGMKPAMVNGFSVLGVDYYTAIFTTWPSSLGWFARHRVPQSTYQCEFDNALGSGFALSHVSGYVLNGAPVYTTVWSEDSMAASDVATIDGIVNGVMKANNIPALSLAISQNGKPVFAKGYGSASIPYSSNNLVCPDSRFRIASLSKSVTAAAIYKLIDQGKLSLNQRVFGVGGVLGTSYGTKTYANGSKLYSANVRAITIRQLLQHTAGGMAWDNQGGDDPMFQYSSLSQSALITKILDTTTVSSTPGTTYAYSNFGYCVLGRIIEKVTGKGYVKWTKDNILNPAGAYGYALAGDTAAARLPREVAYATGSGQGGDPYGMKVARMDAHGGWVASALDVVSFIRAVDGYSEGFPDVISAASWRNMVTGSTPNPGYASGWGVNTASNSTNHDGSLPGCYTIQWRGWSTDPLKRYTISVLTNSRAIKTSDVWGIRDKILAIAGIDRRWPCSFPLVNKA